MSIHDRNWAVRITDGKFVLFAVKTRNPEGIEAIELDDKNPKPRCLLTEFDARQLFVRASNSSALRNTKVELVKISD